MVWVMDEAVGRPRAVVEAARSDGGLWALTVAAGNGRMEVCRYLVQVLRVDVNAPDDKGPFLTTFLYILNCAARFY